VIPRKFSARRGLDPTRSEEQVMNPGKTATLAAGLLALALTGGAFAAGEPQQKVAAAPAEAAASILTAGEVRKVDVEQGKVTIRHEAIGNLDMPAMTMVFRAGKPEVLKDLKAGDRIRFRAESVGGALVVTQIEAAR
jgi:Cu(I)/Ag(I) efflux system periplasmic protein CusF